jgi:multiple sugar transport system permease protein
VNQTSRAAAVLVLIGGAILFVAPLYVMLVMALKTPDEIANSLPWEWPAAPTLANFQSVLSHPIVHFGRLFQNTLFVSIMGTLGTLISSALAAFAFARLEFRGKDRLFLVVLSTMMLPGIVTTIPSYILFAKLGWVNTFYPLWVPSWLFAGAFNIFLLRQFFMGLPRELDEAARLDGASNSAIFWKVIAPLSGPALATVGVFAFIGSWRDFMGPLLYLNTPDMQTLELGLRTFQTMKATEWNLLMAASLLVMAPILVIFVACQRFFVAGLALTGSKS